MEGSKFVSSELSACSSPCLNGLVSPTNAQPFGPTADAAQRLIGHGPIRPICHGSSLKQNAGPWVVEERCSSGNGFKQEVDRNSSDVAHTGGLLGVANLMPIAAKPPRWGEDPRPAKGPPGNAVAPGRIGARPTRSQDPSLTSVCPKLPGLMPQTELCARAPPSPTNLGEQLSMCDIAPQVISAYSSGGSTAAASLKLQPRQPSLADMCPTVVALASSSPARRPIVPPGSPVLLKSVPPTCDRANSHNSRDPSKSPGNPPADAAKARALPLRPSLGEYEPSVVLLLGSDGSSSNSGSLLSGAGYSENNTSAAVVHSIAALDGRMCIPPALDCNVCTDPIFKLASFGIASSTNPPSTSSVRHSGLPVSTVHPPLAEPSTLEVTNSLEALGSLRRVKSLFPRRASMLTPANCCEGGYQLDETPALRTYQKGRRKAPDTRGSVMFLDCPIVHTYVRDRSTSGSETDSAASPVAPPDPERLRTQHNRRRLSYCSVRSTLAYPLTETDPVASAPLPPLPENGSMSPTASSLPLLAISERPHLSANAQLLILQEACSSVMPPEQMEKLAISPVAIPGMLGSAQSSPALSTGSSSLLQPSPQLMEAVGSPTPSRIASSDGGVRFCIYGRVSAAQALSV
jgi:hypothetical protein